MSALLLKAAASLLNPRLAISRHARQPPWWRQYGQQPSCTKLLLRLLRAADNPPIGLAVRVAAEI